MQTLSAHTISELSQVLQWWRQANRGGHIGAVPAGDDIPERHVRWARTQETATCPVYPKSGNALPVVQGKYTFDDSACGSVSTTFVPYAPFEERIAYFVNGWVPEGTIVRMTLHDGRWFVQCAVTGSSSSSSLSSSSSSPSSSSSSSSSSSPSSSPSSSSPSGSSSPSSQSPSFCSTSSDQSVSSGDDCACDWIWDGASWSINTDNCSDCGEDCDPTTEPAFPGTFVGEIFPGGCTQPI